VERTVESPLQAFDAYVERKLLLSGYSISQP
jgi:hypothetical protein